MVRSGGTGLSLVAKVCEAGEDIRSSLAKYLGLTEVLQELLGAREGGYLDACSPDLPGEMGIAPCGHGDAIPSGCLFCALVIGFMTDAGVETFDDLYPIYDRLQGLASYALGHTPSQRVSGVDQPLLAL